MDAVKFIKEWNHLCDTMSHCYDCPLDGCSCDMNFVDHFEDAVNIVSEWSEKYPIKTRQSEFLKQFPHATCDENGILNISPCDMDSTYSLNACKDDRAFTNFTCERCRKEYWSEEVDD